MQAPKLGCTLMRERSHLEICLWVRSSCMPTHAMQEKACREADAGAQYALHLIMDCCHLETCLLVC